MEKCNAKDALKDGIPIVIGFIPIAIAFGMLSKAAGITILESVGFSMIVFAGASQFIALNLLIGGAGIGEIIITTFLVNFRHFLFSASLSPKIDNEMKKKIPLIAFGLTDEIFSIASLKSKELSNQYIILLEFSAYSALAVGTMIGNILGEILPEVIKLSMGIALYALFTAIIVPEMKKSIRVIVIFIIAGSINSILLEVIELSQGWSMIISILFASISGIFIKEKEKEEDNE